MNSVVGRRNSRRGMEARNTFQGVPEVGSRELQEISWERVESFFLTYGLPAKKTEDFFSSTVAGMERASPCTFRI